MIFEKSAIVILISSTLVGRYNNYNNNNECTITLIKSKNVSYGSKLKYIKEKLKDL